MLAHSSRDDCFLINFRGEIAQLLNYGLGFHETVASICSCQVANGACNLSKRPLRVDIVFFHFEKGHK